MLKKELQINTVLSINERILQKMYHSFHKNIKQHSILNLFLEHQIRILEWFLKDHVTQRVKGSRVENSYFKL